MSDALADFVAMFAKMKPADKAEFDKLLAPELGARWLALPGPQTQAQHSKADLLLYGGAAGGGKTDLAIGLALTEHRRSVIFRRAYVDLRGVEERLLEVRGTRSGYNASDMVLKTEDGRLIEFGALEKPGAEMSWQGRPHDLICVGRGTPVMMGDGSFRPVQTLRAGDIVATLEGPRRIVRTFPKRYKQAVEVTAYNVRGEVIARQVQSDNHSLLGSAASASRDTFSSSRRPSSSSPIRSLASRIVGRWFGRTCEPRPCTREGQRSDRPRSVGQWQSRRQSEHPSAPGSSASWGRERLGASFAAIGDAFRGGAQLLGLSGRQALPQPALQSGGAAQGSPRFAFSYDGDGARRTSSPEGSTDRCSAGSHPCDERIPLSWGHCAELAGARLCLLQQGGAERPNPTYFDTDGREQTPIHSLRTRQYAHPYTKGVRHTAAPLSEHSFSYRDLGEQELYDIQVDEVCHYITSGGFINKNCFDEGAQLLENKVRFVMGWLRSAKEGQRTRVVIASNPPLGAEGGWLVTWFAPWLDPLFPKPAANGDLRWTVTLPDGTLRWVDGPGQWVIVGDDEAEATADDIEAGVALEATSRTFIPARLDDNPYLRGTGYRAKLQGLPEPLRSQLLAGDFLAGKEDAANQVIPTAWIEAAQARWERGKGNNVRMLSLGVDVAQGGPDETVLSPLYGAWFDHLVKRKGVDTKDGPAVAALVIATMRDRCNINIDLTGGWGGSARDHLLAQGLKADGVVFSAGSNGRTKDGALYYLNLRTELWWSFREALDPESQEDVALPPDRRLAAQLAAPMWKLRGDRIVIEAKDEIRKRLGTSTDDADAVILAWHKRERIVETFRPKERRDIA